MGGEEAIRRNARRLQARGPKTETENECGWPEANQRGHKETLGVGPGSSFQSGDLRRRLRTRNPYLTPAKPDSGANAGVEQKRSNAAVSN